MLPLRLLLKFLLGLWGKYQSQQDKLIEKITVVSTSIQTTWLEVMEKLRLLMLHLTIVVLAVKKWSMNQIIQTFFSSQKFIKMLV